MALPEIIKALLENGVHFGHLSKHWNPKMKRFIFGKKKNVYIINLEKTAEKLEEAKEFVKQVAEKGGQIFFVATKKQLRDIVKEKAIECGMPYIVERWVGGFITNFVTIRKQVKTYIKLLEDRDKGVFDRMPRKEVVRLNRELDRMDRNYKGAISLQGLPTCLYIIDPKKEIACVKEANKLSIPVIALIDTDADPDVIDYPIPGNDDAIRSVNYITSCIVEAINEGKKRAEDRLKEVKMAEEKNAGEAGVQKELNESQQ